MTHFSPAIGIVLIYSIDCQYDKNRNHTLKYLEKEQGELIIVFVSIDGSRTTGMKYIYNSSVIEYNLIRLRNRGQMMLFNEKWFLIECWWFPIMIQTSASGWLQSIWLLSIRIIWVHWSLKRRVCLLKCPSFGGKYWFSEWLILQ